MFSDYFFNDKRSKFMILTVIWWRCRRFCQHMHIINVVSLKVISFICVQKHCHYLFYIIYLYYGPDDFFIRKMQKKSTILANAVEDKTKWLILSKTYSFIKILSYYWCNLVFLWSYLKNVLLNDSPDKH